MKRETVLWSVIIAADTFGVVAGYLRSVDKHQII
jgi:hypothetical protein